MAEFLLEIGCEEIPASWLEGSAHDLMRQFGELLLREGIEGPELHCDWTPRRLVLCVEMELVQPGRVERVWGPPLSIAKEPTGAWTKAGLGFAKKVGASPEDLGEDARPEIKLPMPQHVYVYFDRQVAPRETASLLPVLIAALLRTLKFPKMMNWDAWLDDNKGSFQFGRPIRWIVALFNGEVVPFSIFESDGGRKGRALVVSSNQTRGHRFLRKESPGSDLRIMSWVDLNSKLNEAHVVLEAPRRAELIRRQLEAGGVAGEVAAVVEEWRDLVEHPTVVFGSVPSEFQSLPREVLETVLVHHQKYLPIRIGGSVTRFAAITNAEPAASQEIVRGMERVVVARLRDGRFFFTEDRKRTLESRVPDLGGVLFHQKLGTYLEKSERLVRIVDSLQDEGLLDADVHQSAREAARLCKADLTTQMVREFTELQGVVGSIYLEQENARGAVSDAIRWHYHPISAEPKAAPAGEISGLHLKTFCAVSLADKLDTLVGYFSIGEEPTGSRDPYGLRRAALGVVQIALELWPASSSRERSINLRTLSRLTARCQARTVAAEVLDSLDRFLLDRLRYALTAHVLERSVEEVEGAEAHLGRDFPAGRAVDAVIGAGGADPLEDPRDALDRAKALDTVQLQALSEFRALAASFKRINNILADVGSADDPQPNYFVEPSEHALYGSIEKARRIHGDYAVRLRALAELHAPVDDFFRDVMVMAEDATLRKNRLALLWAARSLFYRIADISKLGGQA